MHQLKLDLPPNVSVEEARILLSVRLFELKKVSLGKAAELAGLPIRDFIKILGECKIAVFNYTEQDLEEDISRIEQYKKASSE